MLSNFGIAYRNKNELETVSIAEPLQNRQHAQNNVVNCRNAGRDIRRAEAGEEG